VGIPRYARLYERLADAAAQPSQAAR
jgi:hypothetical protein